MGWITSTVGRGESRGEIGGTLERSLPTFRPIRRDITAGGKQRIIWPEPQRVTSLVRCMRQRGAGLERMHWVLLHEPEVHGADEGRVLLQIERTDKAPVLTGAD